MKRIAPLFVVLALAAPSGVTWAARGDHEAGDHGGWERDMQREKHENQKDHQTSGGGQSGNGGGQRGDKGDSRVAQLGVQPKNYQPQCHPGHDDPRIYDGPWIGPSVTPHESPDFERQLRGVDRYIDTFYDHKTEFPRGTPEEVEAALSKPVSPRIASISTTTHNLQLRR